MAKRGQGEGTISKRMVNGVWDGTWWARITVGKDENGKQKRKAFYGKTRKEVQEKLTEALNAINNDTYIEPSSMTVRQWSDIWLKEYKKHSIKASTYELLSKCFRLYINPTIGNCKLKDLRADMAQKMINNLHESGLTVRTISNAKKTLQSALEQAVENDMLSKNIVKSVKMPKETKKKEARVLTPDEQEIFIAEVKNHRYGKMSILILATGLRCGEAQALEWGDIDFENNTLRVNKTLAVVKDPDAPDSKSYHICTPPKTKSSNRIVPLLPTIVSMLRDIRKDQLHQKLSLDSSYIDSNFVFKAPKGGHIWSTCIRAYLRNIGKKIGIEGLHPHCLRHTFATRGLEQGIELKVMQELLGHSSINMTANLYTHVLPEKKMTSIMKLADTIAL